MAEKREILESSDNFLKIDGIDGESQDKKHKNEIEVDTWSGAVSNEPSTDYGGGSGTSVSEHEDFHFLKGVDKASPKLFQACACGEHIKKAVMTCRKAGKDQQEYLTITFTDVLISSFENANYGGINQDRFSFNCGKVEIQYKAQKPDGTLEGATSGGWDIKQKKVPS